MDQLNLDLAAPQKRAEAAQTADPLEFEVQVCAICGEQASYDSGAGGETCADHPDAATEPLRLHVFGRAARHLQIKQAIRRAGRPLSPGEIDRALPNVNYATTMAELRRMRDAGLLVAEGATSNRTYRLGS